MIDLSKRLKLDPSKEDLEEAGKLNPEIGLPGGSAVDKPRPQLPPGIFLALKVTNSHGVEDNAEGVHVGPGGGGEKDGKETSFEEGKKSVSEFLKDRDWSKVGNIEASGRMSLARARAEMKVVQNKLQPLGYEHKGNKGDWEKGKHIVNVKIFPVSGGTEGYISVQHLTKSVEKSDGLLFTGSWNTQKVMGKKRRYTRHYSGQFADERKANLGGRRGGSPREE